MKILLTHFYSPNNNGDAAIVSVMIYDFRRKFPGIELSLSTMEKYYANRRFEGVPLLTSFFYEAIYARPEAPLRTVRTIYILLVTIVWALIYRITKIRLKILRPSIFNLLNAYVDAACIIPVGGGYLTAKNTLRGNITLLIQLHAICTALILDKKVILYSQSVGPFSTSLQKRAVAYVLKRVDAIMVRDKPSYQLLRQLGIRENKIILSVDAAFIFSSQLKSHMKKYISQFKPILGKTVGVTVKQIEDLHIQNRYEESLAGLGDKLVEAGYTVLFIPQTVSDVHKDDDRIIILRIKRRMKFANKAFFLKRNFSPYEIKSLYENLDYLVATRMHSAIFAITAGVPTLAIAYEPKTQGMMEDLQLGNWVVPIKDVTLPLLWNKFQQLTHQTSVYKKRLSSPLLKYTKRARRNIQDLKQAMTKSLPGLTTINEQGDKREVDYVYR